MLTNALLRAWSKRSGLALLLLPVSLVFGALVWLRRRLFRLGILKTQHVNAMVMVVGNVVTGGAGKTPTVIGLVRHLTSQGYTVGVVSRGYGRKTDDCMEVSAQSAPQDVGDEPGLIQRSTQVPVFVGRNRHAAATALLDKYPRTEIIVCDDGLQHYQLHRDLEICVFDDRGCGNGWLLPAGPLREPWPRATTAPQLVLHTGNQPAFAGFTAQRNLAPYAVGQDGSPTPLATLQADGAKPLMALAGIAQPEIFFTMLRAMGLTLTDTLALPDHYDFDSCSRSIHKGYQLICTEKDALKLWQYAPDALAVPLIQTAQAPFFDAIDVCVSQHLTAPLSSHHGHKTT